MKKKIISVVILLMIIGLTLITMSGCTNKSGAKEQLETKSGVEKYLKEQYPNEQFEIHEREEIELTHYNEKEKKSEVWGTGYSYKVKSKNTNIEFTVKNTKDLYSGGFGTYYDITNDYSYNALVKYTEEYNDERIKIEENFNEVRVKLSDFSSIEELGNVIYDFQTYIYSKEPFKSKSNSSVRASVRIGNENDELITFYGLSGNDSVSDIVTYISNQYNRK